MGRRARPTIWAHYSAQPESPALPLVGICAYRCVLRSAATVKRCYRERGRRGLRPPPSILHLSFSALWRASLGARSASRIREADALRTSSALCAARRARRSWAALPLHSLFLIRISYHLGEAY